VRSNKTLHATVLIAHTVLQFVCLIPLPCCASCIHTSLLQLLTAIWQFSIPLSREELHYAIGTISSHLLVLTTPVPISPLSLSNPTQLYDYPRAFCCKPKPNMTTCRSSPALDPPSRTPTDCARPDVGAHRPRCARSCGIVSVGVGDLCHRLQLSVSDLVNTVKFVHANQLSQAVPIVMHILRSYESVRLRCGWLFSEYGTF
jgi:hypothetical protein